MTAGGAGLWSAGPGGRRGGWLACRRRTCSCRRGPWAAARPADGAPLLKHTLASAPRCPRPTLDRAAGGDEGRRRLRLPAGQDLRRLVPVRLMGCPGGAGPGLAGCLWVACVQRVSRPPPLRSRTASPALHLPPVRLPPPLPAQGRARRGGPVPPRRLHQARGGGQPRDVSEGLAAGRRQGGCGGAPGGPPTGGGRVQAGASASGGAPSWQVRHNGAQRSRSPSTHHLPPTQRASTRPPPTHPLTHSPTHPPPAGTSTTTRAWCRCCACCAPRARSCSWPPTRCERRPLPRLLSAMGVQRLARLRTAARGHRLAVSLPLHCARVPGCAGLYQTSGRTAGMLGSRRDLRAAAGCRGASPTFPPLGCAPVLPSSPPQLGLHARTPQSPGPAIRPPSLPLPTAAGTTRTL